MADIMNGTITTDWCPFYSTVTWLADRWLVGSSRPDIGMTLELLSPLFPPYFFALACAGFDATILLSTHTYVIY